MGFQPYVSNVPSARNIFWFRYDEIDLITFQRGIVLSTGFTLSGDRQEIIGLFCGHSASNQ